mmetsp:Transcript_31239/g.31772  ORF Transcript_31239/g.31772 Transcript_31239/m.31772 type:complete len:417 (+) Transcript_31239:69-1319(+)
MSANRKLQSEVDSVLKKVKEGIFLFDDIWDKVYAATQQSLKEKYEGDLKKEIKKLQRLRDQIKTWIGSNEIKDKSQLLECRKNIESKMEQFKVCEKEMKTKAYSREGLARETKLDPREAEKEAKGEWLGSCLDRLGELIDSLEADLERISVTSKKGKNKDTMEKYESRIQKNKWHVARLEQIRRLMDNDCLDPSNIDEIKDDVDYYIESAADDDGAVGVAEEFDIYEVLELDAIPTSMTGKDDDDDDKDEGEKEKDGKEEEDTKGGKASKKVIATVTPSIGKSTAIPAVVRTGVVTPVIKTPSKISASTSTSTSSGKPSSASALTPSLSLPPTTTPATQQAATASLHARVEKKATSAAAVLLSSPSPSLSLSSSSTTSTSTTTTAPSKTSGGEREKENEKESLIEGPEVPVNILVR